MSQTIMVKWQTWAGFKNWKFCLLLFFFLKKRATKAATSTNRLLYHLFGKEAVICKGFNAGREKNGCYRRTQTIQYFLKLLDLTWPLLHLHYAWFNKWISFAKLDIVWRICLVSAEPFLCFYQAITASNKEAVESVCRGEAIFGI